MTELDKYREGACEKLELIISYLGVTAKVSSSEVVGKKLKLKLESEDAGRIIGRRGRTLASVQLLLNSAMHQSDDPLPEIVIEIEGYDRHKREEGGTRRRRGGRREDGDSGGDRNEKRGRDGDDRRDRNTDDDRRERNTDNDDRRERNTDNDDRRERNTDNDDRRDRNKSRNRKGPKRQNENAVEKPEAKEAFSKEDAEYFVDIAEVNEAEEAVDVTGATAEGEQTEGAPETVEERAPEPAAPAAPAVSTSSVPDKPADNLPDNVYQCCQKALDAAKEVRRWGEEITLRGMTGEERQAIKDALKDDPLIDVIEGEVTGPDKRKIILRDRSIEKSLNK